MHQIVLQGKGSSNTFTLPEGIMPRGGSLVSAKIVTDVTIAANGTDYWSAAVTVGGTSVVTALTSAATAFTADTVRTFTVTETARALADGAVVKCTVTKAANGADQSATNFTVVLNYV